MLHEVLLALSGHPSPLFGDRADGQVARDDTDFPLLSPSEKALLLSLGQLSQLHLRLRRHLDSISASHPSIICRATATSIRQTHLTRFQQRILDVEGKILKRNASVVGAYEIVPLATIVGEFDDWHRRMAWYWQIACYMLPLQGSQRGSPNTCSGSRLIDKLRSENQTGFPDIADSSKELIEVAETAWLRQLVPWLLYGKLHAYGAKDFFIQRLDPPYEQTFTNQQQLAPGFVTNSTGSSIQFVGKCILQVQHHWQGNAQSSMPTDVGIDNSLNTKHMQKLSALSLPIVPSQFSKTISEIRLSLSQNVLQHLLPMATTLQALACFRQFFLLERGEFATALVNESEDRVRSRQQSMGHMLQQDPIKAMKGLNIKDADFGQTLQQVWRSLVAEDTEEVDDVLEYAQGNVRLTAPKSASSRSTLEGASSALPAISTTAFNNLLFPTSSELTLQLSSPLDLLLSPEDVSVYSSISSYLLAIRRGNQKLSDLWRRTPARRNHPLSTVQEPEMRRRHKRRANATRKVWATCSAANFLLSETSAFLEGEIIKGSYNHFLEWVQSPAPDIDLINSTASTKPRPNDATAQRDPETLASGHRVFLAALTYAILLNDTPYTDSLRSLLRNVDSLVAFFNRVVDMQQKLDFEFQAGGESPHTLEETQRIALELDRSRNRIDSDLKTVVDRLRQLNHERVGSLRYLDARSNGMTDFEFWKGGGGVDRLLMKLDFGRVSDDSLDIV